MRSYFISLAAVAYLISGMCGFEWIYQRFDNEHKLPPDGLSIVFVIIWIVLGGWLLTLYGRLRYGPMPKITTPPPPPDPPEPQTNEKARLIAAALYPLTRPAEVKVCLTALDHVSVLFEKQLFYDGIKTQVANGFNDPASKDHILRAMHSDNWSATELVLNAIAECSFRRLQLGEGYLYRGVLTMQGQSWRAIFNIAIRELEKLGRHKKEDSDQYIANLNAIIKENG